MGGGLPGGDGPVPSRAALDTAVMIYLGLFTGSHKNSTEKCGVNGAEQQGAPQSTVWGDNVQCVDSRMKGPSPGTSSEAADSAN